jgi:hypothetical protein
MSIKIPIISDFNTRGIEKALEQFKKLETAGQKTKFALNKAFLPATAAVAGLALAATSAAKAAAEDQAAQLQLANQLKNTTGATDAQIKANEGFITSTSMSAAVADDELRPALASLVRGTGDLASAQNALKISLDVAAGTGKSLAEVTDAVAKAYGGNTKAIKQLSPELFNLIKDGASADTVMQTLSKTFGGAAATSANSAEGQFRKFGIAMNELKESIGVALLPLFTKFLGFLTNLAIWAGQHTGIIVGIAAAIGTIATAIITVNIAFKAYKAAALLAEGINYALATSFTAVEISTGIGIAAVIAGAAALALYVTKIKGVQKSLSGAGQSAGKILGPEMTPEAIKHLQDLQKASNGAGGAVDSMKQKIEAARKAIEDKFNKALDDANKKLADAKQAYNDFAKSVSGQITGGVSFSDALSQGAESGKTFLGALKDQADATKEFAGKVKQLIVAGLSKAGLQQVLDAGQQAGTQIADELIAGGVDAISQANELLQSVQDLADQVGISAADQWYAAGVSNAQTYVDAITSTIARYKEILKNPNLTLKQLTGLSDQFSTDTTFAGMTSDLNVNQGVQDFMAQRQLGAAQQGTVINISGGLSTSSDIAQSVVDALRFYNQNVGPVRISTV